MFLLKNVQKYRKIYKKLVKSSYENTEQKMVSALTVPAHPLVLLHLPEGCLCRCVATGENGNSKIRPIVSQLTGRQC